ncbi:hypothetical protein CON36_31065 [Bacillus cereus]|uniref:NTP pyrophosphohydrolase MazG-like domain-containing protein n=2 Tax=Bacillus cereus group TaxID=86661 RepID=A0A9X6SU36_BACCE|nr:MULTISPECIES: MazG nucleotide pyrophosphohydrolase domain-containing protein [Bacillus cereus group]PDZ94951.1 hypothetical protein CON36_31065 [Bacillus cereus]PFJ24805.1 hypothetical protein COJ15_36175 [Bacillus thuringiensis]PGP11583.1 hypothetical protein COA01_35615 [Bacillus cereus]
MKTAEMERLVMERVKRQDWSLNPREDLNSIVEELGELSREVRRYETGRQRPDETEENKELIIKEMASEIGDILFPLIKVAQYYGITLEQAFLAHHTKMEQRYK